MNEEQKACPFCGSKARVWTLKEEYYVACTKCKISTPCYVREASALRCWNRR